MLHEFLELNRDAIISLCEEKTRSLAGGRSGSEQLKLGLPLFYDQLIKVLELKLNSDPTPEMLVVAAEHGKEFLRLGYSLSHVVHAYGAMCQSITELAMEKNTKISAKEFNILNASLDSAIAAAVSEFEFIDKLKTEAKEIQHLGYLAHELRNALSSATVAHDMIKAGLVGVGGSTAAILEVNFSRMRLLIDRSLTEVRLRADADLVIEKMRLFDVLEQIAITARIDASKKKQILTVEVDLDIDIETDRQMIISAISNVVQNAIKYTKRGGLIFLRGKKVENRAVIEIDDQCGGLAVDKISSLFEPFVQENEDRSGLGIGLAIAKKAIYLCQGSVRVENKPGTGCVFRIDIPLNFLLLPSKKASVRGKDSVQPKSSMSK